MAKGRETTGETGADAGAESSSKKPAGATGQGMVDLEFVKGLIEAVDGSGIDSLEITRAGTRVKIAKTPPSAGPAPTYLAAPQAHVQAPPQGPAPVPPAAAQPQEPPSAAESKPAESAPTADTSGLTEIKSPMVGTFYRAPAPEAPPYVEVGTKVSKGQTLCILEAMKLMNELESEAEGVVKEILVENAEPVEYGQVLFRIDPNG